MHYESTMLGNNAAQFEKMETMNLICAYQYVVEIITYLQV